MTFFARQLRTTTRPAVVVVREAHLMDGEGTTKGLEPIPEAARLETGERRGRLVHIRHGSTEGWLPGSALRFLRDR